MHLGTPLSWKLGFLPIPRPARNDTPIHAMTPARAPQHHSLAAIVCRFILLYALLIAPWPGWNAAYGSFFRALCGTALSSRDGPREVAFEPFAADGTDTRIIVAERALLNADGSGPIRNVDVDSSGFWRSTALLLALVLTTPIPWPRRGWALLWGLAGIHCVFVLSVGFLIWNQSTYLSEQTFTPLRKALADGLGETMVDQFSLAAPVLLWILVTFRRGDEWLLALVTRRPPGATAPASKGRA